MNKVVGSIITDCHDDATRARQEIRFDELFGVRPTFVGVDSYMPIEAAGILIDQLDVLINFPLHAKDRDAIILVNVAPRSEDVKKKWDNGTPFCYFKIGRILVVSAYEGHCLALVRDLGLAKEVQLMDIPTVNAAAIEWGDLTSAQADKIANSQFRSLEFLPLAAHWVWQGKPVPSESHSLDELPSAKGQAWLIDNFSNVKTTLLPEDVGFEPGKTVTLADGQPATCYRRLADVPKDVTGLTIGSSGFGQNRFLEVAVGGKGQAAVKHNLTIGASVLATD